MNRKLLFFDVDGTLAMPGKYPPESTVRAIRTAREKGHLAFLGTGRAQYMVHPEIMEIGFDGGIFNAGGRNMAGEMCISDYPMSTELMGRAMEILEEEDAFYLLEGKTALFRGPLSPGFFEPFASYGNGKGDQRIFRVISTWAETPNIADHSHLPDEPVYKISFYCFEEERMKRIRGRLSEFGRTVYFEGFVKNPEDIRCGEVSGWNTDKGKGLRDICAYYGADISDTIAFGDSMNDLEMLKAAGLGIAMGNAEQNIKKIADRVCGSCEEDGIATALRTILL